MTLLTTNTHTSNSDSESSFESSIDSTYKLYIFKFIDINPATDGAKFTCQFNVASASGYDENITSTAFRAYHDEADSATAFAYLTANDQDNDDQVFQHLNTELGNGGDECLTGELHLFDPSNTTFKKHFYARTNGHRSNDATQEFYVGGYVNSTTAVTNVQFKMDSGNMDGIIKMYGVG